MKLIAICVLFLAGCVAAPAALGYDKIENPGQAFQAAKAFGEFQKQVTDMPVPRLHETIPDFHHTAKRFQRLQEAVAADVCNRAIGVRAEIDFALEREELAQRLVGMIARGELPERITHNGTKLNNVLLDAVTGEAMCVIDLDTVMPGTVLYDFGDLMRTSTSPAAEDEKDVSRVVMQMPMFEALVQGYLSSARPFLTPAEIALLTFSGVVMTFEVMIRFLTDHLQGDTYFKIHREGHNLDPAARNARWFSPWRGKWRKWSGLWNDLERNEA